MHPEGFTRTDIALPLFLVCPTDMEWFMRPAGFTRIDIALCSTASWLLVPRLELDPVLAAR